jgi:hypothetical protein
VRGERLSFRVFDNNYITEEQLNELLERTDSLSRKTYNLMQHLKTSDLKNTIMDVRISVLGSRKMKKRRVEQRI